MSQKGRKSAGRDVETARVDRPLGVTGVAGERSRELLAAFALLHSPGLGPVSQKKLVEHYSNPGAAVDAVSSWVRDKAATSRQAEAFVSGSWKQAAEQALDAALQGPGNVLLCTDPAYPERLWEIPNPPLILYYMGNPELLANPGVAIVGSRKCTRYGIQATADIGKGLSRAGLTIISGMAYGIDRQAHLSGLSGVGSSIAVMGAGLDVDYPSGNRDVRVQLNECGLVLTEYGPGVHPEARNFPVRNRIISGLSLGVVVTEAALKSGSLITARLALDNGREVFAVPGPIGQSSYSGCHRLINQGARLVCSAEDVLLELAPLLKAGQERQKPAQGEDRAKKDARAEEQTLLTEEQGSNISLEGMSEDQRLVLEAVVSGGRKHVDELALSLSWDVGKTSRVLLELEMLGHVRQLPGMIYGAA